MATMTISLPDQMKEWVEDQIKIGDYASTSDYVRDLIRKDRQRRVPVEYSLEDLRRLVADAEASGLSDETIPSILARAKAAAKIPR
jgi:antitoxin ParD1/3/4